MRFRYYPVERLMIESIASRLTSAENDLRMWLMQYTINNGAPYNIKTDAAAELRDVPTLVHGLARKRAIVLDANGNVNFIYPVSALPTHHRVHLKDGRSFSAMCAIDALGAAFTFKQDIKVESRCSECGEPIHVEVKDGRIAHHYPDSTHVLHVDLNKADNWAGSC